MKMTDKMQQVAIDKLIPYVNNARTHSPEQINKIRASLREFGFVAPIIIDADFNVLVGHGRLEAAKAEKYKEVPCVFVEHLTEAQKKAYIIADNRLALDAGWDEELLAVEMADLSEQAFDLSLTGFSEDELTALLTPSELEDGPDMPEGLAEDDDVDLDALLEKPAFVQKGDLWLLGRHRLYCGDSTKAEDVAALMDGKKANLIVTDPPYNVAYEGKTAKKLTISNDSMSADSFYSFLFAAFQRMAEVTVPGGAAYIFHADTEGLNFRHAFQDAGFQLHEVLIWNKNSMVLGHSDYHWKHEPILYGWLAGGKHKWYSDRSQVSVWDFKRPARSDKHPTSKPLDLISYPILNSSAEGDIVIDFFGGSGSTLMASEQTGRVCYTMELDPQYASVIVERFAEVSTFDDVFCVRDGKKYAYDDIVEGDEE